jgi:SHS2 domain-containing protein
MYETFEHKADIGVRGKARKLEEAFCEAAKAMFSVEVDLKKVRQIKKIKIQCSAQNVEELFVEWLNALLAQASINEMVFSKFEVRIENDKLTGVAYGEKLKTSHKPKIEIKAATYSQLKVFQDKKTKKWICQCIVDV